MVYGILPYDLGNEIANHAIPSYLSPVLTEKLKYISNHHEDKVLMLGKGIKVQKRI